MTLFEESTNLLTTNDIDLLNNCLRNAKSRFATKIILSTTLLFLLPIIPSRRGNFFIEEIGYWNAVLIFSIIVVPFIASTIYHYASETTKLKNDLLVCNKRCLKTVIVDDQGKTINNMNLNVSDWNKTDVEKLTEFVGSLKAGETLIVEYAPLSKTLLSIKRKET